MKKLLLFILGLLILPLTVSAATTFPVNGGTGSTTLGGIIAGNGTSPVKSVVIGPNLTFDGTTLSASGGSSGLATTSPWNPLSLVQVIDNGHVTSIATSSLNLTTSAFKSQGISQWTNDSGYITGNQTITLSGAVSGSGTTAITTSYAGTLGNTLGGTGQNSSGWTGLVAVNAGGWYQVSTSSPVNLNISGNAGTATILQNTRSINGIHFNGSSDITITAASSSLLGDSNTFSGNNLFTSSTTFSSQLNINQSSTSLATFANVYDTALTSGNCVQAGAGGILTTTAGACGSGSGGVTSIQQTYGTTQSGAITLATTSASFNGLTVADAITNSGTTFTIFPLWSGTLNNSGLSNSTIGITASSPLTGGGTPALGGSTSIGCQTASGSQAGCLASTDWTTFNNKQSALTFSTGLNNTGGTVTNTGVISVSGTTNQIASSGGTTPIISLPSQIIAQQASTTIFSVQGGPLYVGQTSTSTIQGNGATSTLNSTLLVASTSPNAVVVQDQYGSQDVVEDTASTTGPIFEVAATTSPQNIQGAATVALFTVDQYGTITASSTGATPTLTTCGTNPTLTAGSNNQTGDFVMGTAAPAACTFNFSTTLPKIPEVFVENYSSTLDATQVTSRSTTGFTITLNSGLSSDDIGYWVLQHP